MAIANVVLKDGSGNDVTYNRVSQINVIEDSGAERTYTDMSILSAYYGTYDNGTGKYTIVQKWMTACGAGYAVTAPNGNYSMIVTLKKLTVGNSYYPSELGGD